MIVNLYWDQVHETPFNPRRHADPERLRELMASILSHGVMQNLVVRPEPRRPLTDYEAVCGSRRLAAVALLVKEGRLAPDFTLPCRIRELSDLEVLHLATVENMQRQDLTPLEEADAFARMIELGDDGETIAAVTGLSLRTVNQRLALHHRLAPAVRRVLEAGEINLGQAQAFTVGEPAAQERLVGQVTTHPGGWRAPDIRRILLDRTIPLSRAIFDPALYRGGFVRDLFEDQSYASDPAEFRRLQLEACEARKAELGADLVVGRIEDRRVGRHVEFRQRPAARDRRRDRPSARRSARRDPHRPRPPLRGSPSPSPIANGGERDGVRGVTHPLSRAHLVWARQEKSRRLQLAVAGNPAVATSLAILGLLNSGEVRIRAGGWGDLSPDDRFDNPALQQLIDEHLAAVDAHRGYAYGSRVEAAIFDRLMRLPGVQRLALFAALVAPHFASWPRGNDPDLGDGELAVAVAEALGVAQPAEPFVPTPAYLERLSRAQLHRVAASCGVTEAAAAMKKAELVDQILLDPGRDPAWQPPELTFDGKAEILAAIAAKPAEAEAAE